MGHFVGHGIDSCIQPILLIIESNLGFMDQNMIQIPVGFGL